MLLYPGPATHPWPGAHTAYTTVDPDNPFIRDGAVYAMMPDWALMMAVTNGTAYISLKRSFSSPKSPAKTPTRTKNGSLAACLAPTRSA